MYDWNSSGGGFGSATGQGGCVMGMGEGPADLRYYVQRCHMMIEHQWAYNDWLAETAG
jgi:hypothetical protein